MSIPSQQTTAAAAHAPSAAGVTYLFSDVEGSTRLWETEPERVGPALAWHDRLSRAAVQRHHGTLVKMTGDGIHAAFDDPADALAAVVEIQCALQAPAAGEHTAGLALRVRCGLHAGADQRRDNDFFGRAVNRAARIMQAAHGGQVLLSQAVADRVQLRLPAGAALRDLGQVRLRDLTGTERIFQLLHPQLRVEFPPLRSLASTPNNLAQQVNSFVGRERELGEVRAQLADPSIRLLTLLGMGGLGKSRLSVQVAAEVLDEFPDGVWFIELAPLSDARSVPQALASVLGVKEEAGGSALDAVLKYVADKTLLVVLDNCEHVVQACAELAKALLQAAPQLKVLTSSRDALQIAGEMVYQVMPLAAPAAGTAATPAMLAGVDAVQLFIDRASAAQPAFRVTDKNAAAVAEICRQLDGIPLALELAAARTRALSVEAIAARLNDRFKLLVTGDRTVLPRQRTLRALIDWSYDLLAPAERTLFARLSVFAGGWTLEAAEAVGADGDIDTADVLDLLARLVEKSLVIADIEGGRYRMLDTVRQYAQQRLTEFGDAGAAQERHLQYFATLVEQVRLQLFGAERARWLARLDDERENTLTAHAWCAHSPQGAALDFQLVFGLKFYWLNRGLLALGARVVGEALARPGAEKRDLARSRGLSDAGQICYFMGRYDEARGLLRESLAIARELGSAQRQVPVLQFLSMVELAIGDADTALLYGQEAVGLARSLATPHVLSQALNNLAQLQRARGAHAEALVLYDEALALARGLHDEETVAIALLNRAMALIAAGDARSTLPLLHEALLLAGATGSRAVGQSLIEVCSGLAAAYGDWDGCRLLYEAAEAQAQRSGLRRDPADAAFLAAAIGRARAASKGQDSHDGSERRGRAMDYEQAIEAARAYLGRAAAAGD